MFWLFTSARTRQIEGLSDVVFVKESARVAGNILYSFFYVIFLCNFCVASMIKQCIIILLKTINMDSKCHYFVISVHCNFSII